MKKLYFLIAILIGTASYGQLVINEILADPDGSILGDANGDGVRNSTQDEFIEIYNIGAPVNLNGYTISDSVLTRHIFPDVTLNSGEFITVFGGGTPTGFSGIVQTALGGSLGLNNGGDTVTLANADGDIIAQVNYGPEAGANTSIARDPDFTGDFVQHLSHSINPIIFSPDSRNDAIVLNTNTNLLERFKVYPNPTNGEFFINYANSNVINVKIYDLLGKQVYHKNITSNERIKVDNVKSGIYILKINEDGKTSTKKLVIR